MDILNRSVSLTLRRVLLTGIILLTVLGLAFASFGIYFSHQIDRLWEAHKSRSFVEAAVTSTVSLYTLREHEGKIGIFESGEATPLQILDVYVFTLPEADRLALRSGIRVYSSDALRSLIEDFTG